MQQVSSQCYKPDGDLRVIKQRWLPVQLSKNNLMHKRMTSSNKEWSSIRGVWTINSMLKVVSWCWLLTSSARRRRVCVQPGGFPKSKREGAPTDSRLLAFRRLDGNSRAAARNHTEFLEVFTRDGVYFGSIREDDVETAVGLKVTFWLSVSWVWACACSFRNTAWYFTKRKQGMWTLSQQPTDTRDKLSKDSPWHMHSKCMF